MRKKTKNLMKKLLVSRSQPKPNNMGVNECSCKNQGRSACAKTGTRAMVKEATRNSGLEQTHYLPRLGAFTKILHDNIESCVPNLLTKRSNSWLRQ